MNVIYLSGLSGYAETCDLQERMVQAHHDDPSLDDELLLLEHEPVYTIGRTRDHSSLNEGAHLPHPVHEINRGGQATYHGPGQLVGYPIVDLNRMGRDLHRYIRGLEETLIETCGEFGIDARIREGLVGIWVDERKLASIGVGVRKWVTMHGFAINVTPESLPPFLSITPCGLQDVKITCLESELKMAGYDVPDDLMLEFGEKFSELWERHCEEERERFEEHEQRDEQRGV